MSYTPPIRPPTAEESQRLKDYLLDGITNQNAELQARVEALETVLQQIIDDEHSHPHQAFYLAKQGLANLNEPKS